MIDSGNGELVQIGFEGLIWPFPDIYFRFKGLVPK